MEIKREKINKQIKKINKLEYKSLISKIKVDEKINLEEITTQNLKETLIKAAFFLKKNILKYHLNICKYIKRYKNQKNNRDYENDILFGKIKENLKLSKKEFEDVYSNLNIKIDNLSGDNEREILSIKIKELENALVNQEIMRSEYNLQRVLMIEKEKEMKNIIEIAINEETRKIAEKMIQEKAKIEKKFFDEMNIKNMVIDSLRNLIIEKDDKFKIELNNKENELLGKIEAYDYLISDTDEKMTEIKKQLDTMKKYEKHFQENKMELDEVKRMMDNYKLMERRINEETYMVMNTIKSGDDFVSNYVVKIIGEDRIESKIKDMADCISHVTNENNKLKETLKEINNKYEKLRKDMKSEINNEVNKITKKMSKIQQGYNYMMNFYYYIKNKKYSNQKKYEFIEKHNCDECKKMEINQKTYASFPINHVIITKLKNKGLSRCVFLDPKKACDEMMKYHLKAISYLTKKYGGKAATWYRFFILKKNNITKEKMKTRDEMFYYTYLSKYVRQMKKENVIDNQLDDFLNTKEKKQIYYKYYRQLDRELKTKTTLYDLTKHQWKKINKKKNQQTKRTIVSWCNSTFDDDQNIRLITKEVNDNERNIKSSNYKLSKKLATIMKSQGYIKEKNIRDYIKTRDNTGQLLSILDNQDAMKKIRENAQNDLENLEIIITEIENRFEMKKNRIMDDNENEPTESDDDENDSDSREYYSDSDSDYDYHYQN